MFRGGMMEKPDAYLGKEVNRMKQENITWNIRRLGSASQPHAILDGKNVLMMCTNNYLGLSTHPKLKKAMIDATEKFGVGAGAVPGLSGNSELQKDFEEKLAKFKEVEATDTVGHNSISEVWFDGTGIRYVFIQISNADGSTGTEAGDIACFYRYF